MSVSCTARAIKFVIPRLVLLLPYTSPGCISHWIKAEIGNIAVVAMASIYLSTRAVRIKLAC